MASRAQPAPAALPASDVPATPAQPPTAAVLPLSQHLSFLRACAAVNSVKLSEPLASDPMPLVAAVTKVVADAAGNALLAEQDRAVAEDAA